MLKRKLWNTWPIIIAAILSACSAQTYIANSDWHEVSSEHFTLYTDGQVDLIVELAKDLERFRLTLPNLTTATLPKNDRLIIYAAASNLSYKALLGAELARTTGGYFQPNMYGDLAFVNINAYRNTSKGKSYWARRFLFHEYSHFIVNASSAINYPYWYSEGNAELVSTMEFKGDEISFGGIPAERGNELFVNGVMDLGEMLVAQRGSLSQREVGSLYASAWLFTHMLSKLPKYQTKVPDYLLLQAKSSDPIKAFEEGFGIGVDEADKDLKAYLKGSIASYSYRNDAGFPQFEVVVKKLQKHEVASKLGVLHALSGNSVEQLNEFKKSFATNNIDEEAFNYSLLLAYINEDRVEEARSLAALLPINSPSQPWPLFVKAEWLRKQAELQPEHREAYLTEAYNIYKELLASDKTNASLWYGLGVCASQLMVRPATYAKYFGQAYYFNSRHPIIIDAYIEALYEAENWHSLASVIRPIIDRTPDANMRFRLKRYVEFAEKQIDMANNSTGTSVW